MDQSSRFALKVDAATCRRLARGEEIAIELRAPLLRREFWILPDPGSVIELYAEVADRIGGRVALRVHRLSQGIPACVRVATEPWVALAEPLPTYGAGYVLNRTDFRHALERFQQEAAA